MQSLRQALCRVAISDTLAATTRGPSRRRPHPRAPSPPPFPPGGANLPIFLGFAR